MRLLGVSDFLLSLIQKGEVLNLKMCPPFQPGLGAWGDQTAAFRCLEHQPAVLLPQSVAQERASRSDSWRCHRGRGPTLRKE